MNMHSIASSARITRFGSNASIITARPGTEIDLDTIARVAPAVFASEKHESRSERYAFIDTRSVIEGLLREGFQVAEVRQGGSRIAGKSDFTKHMLRLRHASQSARDITTDAVVPEVVLFNSHDGTSAYRMFSGLFRFICTNGLISGEIFEDVKVAHKGNVADKVIEGAFRIIDQGEAVIENSRAMAALELSRGEQLAFAKAALELRWDDPERAAPIEPAALINPRRNADNGADLWRTFNRAQEGLIRGGQHYVGQRTNAAGHVQRTSNHVAEVRGIDQTRGINRALWTLAAEMQKLKQAA